MAQRKSTAQQSREKCSLRYSVQHFPSSYKVSTFERDYITIRIFDSALSSQLALTNHFSGSRHKEKVCHLKTCPVMKEHEPAKSRPTDQPSNAFVPAQGSTHCHHHRPPPSSLPPSLWGVRKRYGLAKAN